MNRQEIEKELINRNGTLLSFPDRGPWGDNRYRGNCSGWIHAFLIWKYKIDRLFAELFSGSGTGYDVCKDMGVPYIGADLNPEPSRPGILHVNAITDEVPEEFRNAQMVFMHPPYGLEIGIPYAGAEWGAKKKWEKVNGKNKCITIDYTDEIAKKLGYNPKQYDLGQMEWKVFIKTLNEIIMKYYSAMAPGSYMSILMGDVRRNGKCYSMLTDIVKPGNLEQIIIKGQHNCVSNGRTYGNLNFVPIQHEYLYVLKKVMDTYYIHYLYPAQIEIDIRNSKSASWCDVIQATLYKLGGKAHYTEIVKEIKDHEKAKTNNHLPEKTRQVLRSYSKVFKPCGDGYYALAA